MSTDSTLKNSAPPKEGPEKPKILPEEKGGKISPAESAPPPEPPLDLDGINEESLAHMREKMEGTSPRPSPQGGEGVKKEGEPVFDGSEERMAERLGLSREHLVLLRQKHLTEGVEFERKDRAVRYHKAGAEKMLKLMALPAEALQALIRAALPELPPIGKRCTVVVRRVLKHRSVIEGYLPGMDKEDAASVLRIRVRGDVNLYTRGMELPCVRVQDDLFECLAPAPRWKGRW